MSKTLYIIKKWVGNTEESEQSYQKKHKNNNNKTIVIPQNLWRASLKYYFSQDT